MYIHALHCLYNAASISIKINKCSNNFYNFFICAQLELFCDFQQFDWLHEWAAFYDILARGVATYLYEQAL